MARKKEKTLEEKLQEALVPEKQWPYILPENWCWTRLKYISKKISDGSHNPPKNSGSGIPLLSAANVCEFSIDMNSANRWILEEEWVNENKRTCLEKGDVLLTIVATIGRVAIVENEKFALQRSVAVIKPNQVLSKYLMYFLASPYIQAFMHNNAKGTAQKGFYLKSLEQLYIALPSLPEQKRIVRRIESPFAKLDEAKEKIQQVLDGAEMRKAAILHKAFTGELTKNWRKENGISEDSWESVKLKELGELNRGKSKHRPRNDPRLFNGPYPFIQTGDVSSSGMYIQKHSQTLSEFGMQQSRLFPKDTLCITIAANIGKVAILTYDCCFPDSVVGFTPNERTFSKYMYYSMLKIQKEIEALAPAVAQKNLSLKLLLDVNVQIPSVEEQHTIVKIIERLLKHEKNVISSSMRSIESIETMKKSILAKAFRGELGTNNPTEYSALNLLKEVLQDKS